MSDVERLLAEQALYYRERAGEYEDWWFRRDRYDHGPETNACWFADAAEVEDAMEGFAPAGDVLELACGTGLWTQRLVSHAASVTAIDGSPEMLELCRARVDDPRVRYVQADLFAWEPDKTYDVCFFGFWLSHIPENRFETFWEKVRRAVWTGGPGVLHRQPAQPASVSPRSQAPRSGRGDHAPPARRRPRVSHRQALPRATAAATTTRRARLERPGSGNARVLHLRARHPGPVASLI